MGETAVVQALVGWDEMREACDAAVARFVAMLRALPEETGALPVPGMDWTVAETAAHLVGIVGRGLGDLRRGATLAELHELNARCIAEVETRTLSDIADRIEADWSSGAPLRAAARGDEPFPLHAGVVAEVAAAISYGVWDFLVHGFDIARATGYAWRIDPEEAARVLRAALPALRPWIRDEVIAGSEQRLVVTFSTGGPALDAVVGGGRYEVALTDAEEADAAVDPVHTLLAVSGREPARDPLVQRLADWFQPI